MNRRAELKTLLIAFALMMAAETAQAGINPKPTWLSIEKAKLKEKVGAGSEVDEGFAQTKLPVDFVSEAYCDCDAPSLVYTWDFGDGVTAVGANVSHAYADADGGTRTPFLKVKCSHCSAEAESPKLTVHAISGIRVDRIGDRPSPAADGRLSFPDELRVQATALPVGVSGSDLVDWDVLLFLADVNLANTGTGNLPNPPDAQWPTQNTYWGPNKLFISIDGPQVSGQQGELRLTGELSYIAENKDVRLFYSATGTENPTDDPNWYYYWTNALGNGPHSYVAAVDYGFTSFAGDITIGANAYAPNGIPRHMTENFIDAFGLIVSHEKWHRAHVLHNISVHGRWDPLPAEDVDRDFVCDREPTDPPAHTAGWEKANGTNSNLLETNPGTPDFEWIPQQKETDPNASLQDWAHPGSQWN